MAQGLARTGLFKLAIDTDFKDRLGKSLWILKFFFGAATHELLLVGIFFNKKCLIQKKGGLVSRLVLLTLFFVMGTAHATRYYVDQTRYTCDQLNRYLDQKQSIWVKALIFPGIYTNIVDNQSVPIVCSGSGLPGKLKCVSGRAWVTARDGQCQLGIECACHQVERPRDRDRDRGGRRGGGGGNHGGGNGGGDNDHGGGGDNDHGGGGGHDD